MPIFGSHFLIIVMCHRLQAREAWPRAPRAITRSHALVIFLEAKLLCAVANSLGKNSYFPLPLDVRRCVAPTGEEVDADQRGVN